MTELPPHLIFYDGLCAMCNGIVKWMLRVDKERVFRFASLQGKTAEAARRLHPQIPGELATMVYLEGDAVYLRSQGAFQAMRHLPYPWKALSWLRFLPVVLTDFFYRILARSRYRIFGRYDQCPLPEPEVRDRFLP